MAVFSVFIFRALNLYYLGIWGFKFFFTFVWMGVNSLLSRKERIKFRGVMGLNLRVYAVITKKNAVVD